MHSPILWCNNIEVRSLASNLVFHAKKKKKQIEIDIHFVRQKVIAKELDIRYVPTEEQIVDLLTKPLTTTRFELLHDKLIFAKA